MTHPAEIDGALVVAVADLAASTATGKTRHVVGEEEGTDFAGLAIAKYDGEPGVYLFYCDEAWNSVTDTFHETMEDAVQQAEFEFEPVVFHQLRPV